MGLLGRCGTISDYMQTVNVHVCALSINDDGHDYITVKDDRGTCRTISRENIDRIIVFNGTDERERMAAWKRHIRIS